VITIPAAVKIFIGSAPIDMRKSIDGLKAIVEEELQENVFTGDFFVFVSRGNHPALVRLAVRAAAALRKGRGA
jgi:transposase